MDRHEPADPGLEQTLARARDGDGDAWAVLVNTYSRRVYGLLVRQCGDRELAEEITQATFVKVVTKIGRYTEKGRFEAWLFRIAMNLLRDEMRRRKRQARTIGMSHNGADRATRSSSNHGGASDAGAWAAAEQRASHFRHPSELDPSEQVSRAEQVDRLRRAIATMSDSDQELLHLRYTAGLSFAQIADALDQPLGTVLARGHRALGKLKKLMQQTHA